MYDDYAWYQDYPQDAFYVNIMDSLVDLQLLLDKCPYENLKETFCKMIFVHAITLMETYLGDTIISAIKEKESFLERAIQNCQELKDKKLSLHQIFKNSDIVQNTVFNEISKVIFHNLSKVIQIYKAIFDITLPHPEALLKLIATRHDIVHRNGKNKAGEKININKERVIELFKEIESFISDVDSKVQEKLQNDS
jgi:hypothetical protein